MTLLLLARQDIDANSTDERFRTPLDIAAMKGHLPLVKILLASSKVSANELYGNINSTILNSASELKTYSDEMLNLLIPYVSQEVVNQSLFNTSTWGLTYSRLISFLVSRGVTDINASDTNGRNLFRLASARSSWGAVKMLIQHPRTDLSSIDIPDDYGDTLLSRAAAANEVDVVKIVLATGKVDPNRPDILGYTPLSKAIENNKKEIINALLKTGKMELNARNNRRETMLGSAIRKGRTKELGRLLKIDGVDMSAVDASGKSALELAKGLYEEVNDVDSVIERKAAISPTTNTPGFRPQENFVTPRLSAPAKKLPRSDIHKTQNPQRQFIN